MYNKDIIDNLTTLYEYKKKKSTDTHILDLKNNKQRLYLYGTTHTNNYKDKKFIILNEKLNTFIKDWDINKIVIVHEDIKPKDILDTKIMIEKYNESGWIFSTLKNKKIKTASLEVNQKKIFNFVLHKKNNKLDVLLWLLLNVINSKIINQNINESEVNNIKITIKNLALSFKMGGVTVENLYIKLFKRLKKITNENIIPSNLEKINEHIFNKNYVKKIQDPFIKYTKLNDIGRDINLARDYFMADKIIKELKLGKSVFGVLGINHVICQAKIYKKIL